MPNRQVWGSSTNWRASSGSWASPWASVVRWGRRSRTSAAAVSAARRELNSPRVRPSSGVDELDDLVELGLAEPVATGRRQVAGDVEDRLAAVVERRPGVEAAPGQGTSPAVGVDRPVKSSVSTTRSAGLEADRHGHRGEVAAEHQGGRGEHRRLVGEQLVAHLAPHLQRRHAQPRRDAVAALAQPEHVAAARGSHPLGGHEDLLHQPAGLGAAGVDLALRPAPSASRG